MKFQLANIFQYISPQYNRIIEFNGLKLIHIDWSLKFAEHSVIRKFVCENKIIKMDFVKCIFLFIFFEKCTIPYRLDQVFILRLFFWYYVIYLTAITIKRNKIPDLTTTQEK